MIFTRMEYFVIISMIITATCKIHFQKGISKLNKSSNDRQGKLLGLFTIVTFPNYECNTESENLRGKNTKACCCFIIKGVASCVWWKVMSLCIFTSSGISIRVYIDLDNDTLRGKNTNAVSYSKVLISECSLLLKDDSDKNRILTYFFPTISLRFSAFNQKITFRGKYG